MNKKFVLTVLAVVVVIVGVVYIRGRDTTPKTLTTVKIGQLQLVGNWPLFVADKKEYFAKEGITVEYVNFQSSNQIMDALIRGDIQVSYFASLPVLAAQTTDPDKVKIFAFGDYSKDNPFDSLLVKSDSGIQSVQDLAGKKIGVFPGTTGTNFVRRYLENLGVDTSKIEFIQTPPATQLQALSAGSIDALHAYELNVATALEQGVAKKLQDAIFAQVLDHAAIGTVVAQTQWIEGNPKLAEDFINAYESGLKFGNAHESETREIVQEKFKLSPEIAKRVTLLGFSMYKDYDFRLFEQLAKLSAEIGDLKSVPNVSNLIYKP